jgi:diguanylate cyclase (GGDEF)-like protein
MRETLGMKRAPIGAHLLAIFAVCLVSLAAIVGYSGRSAFERERADAAAEVGSAAQYAAAGLASQLSSLPTFLQAIATEPGVVSFDPAACGKAVSSYSHFGLGFVSLVRPDGSVVCTSEPLLGRLSRPYFSGQMWFARVRTGQNVDGTVTMNPITGKPAFIESVPVAGPSGQSGELVALLDPAFLSLGADNPLRASDMELLVMDQNRRVILSASGTDRRFVGQHLAGTGLSHPVNGSSLPGPDGVTRIYAEATVKGAGWRVAAGLPTAKALAEAWAELWKNLEVGGLMLALVAALGLLLRRRIVRPIRTLTAAIERAGRGRNGALAPVEGPAELATVSAAFNTMLKERDAFEDFLAHQASHDSLTRLPNRSLILERLSDVLNADQEGALALAVAFLDLDRFKLINDTHGHAAGDIMLVSVATRLQEVLTDDEIVARFGGDEFVILCTSPTEEPGRFAQRIASVLQKPFVHRGQEIFLSGSIGIALSTLSSTAEGLLAEADTAMYRAKESGQAYTVFDADMRAGAASRLSIEAGLHRAVEKDELVLHYQPSIRLADGTLVGVEALVRWHRPGHGMVPPAEFIPIAEETGLIIPIGTWVLEEACRQAAEWRSVLNGEGPRVAVNVSALQLTQSAFPDRVADVLAGTGLPASALCLELTESVLINDSGSARMALVAIRAQGVTVSLDDFGTGYASLGYLQQYPVDELKVDRSFVSQLGPDFDRGAIVRSVVDLAHSLRMSVVAEGVETLDQLVALRRMGCDMAQGYYFSKPVPAEELTAALAGGRPWELDLILSG